MMTPKVMDLYELVELTILFLEVRSNLGREDR
jgi:hypothetical protein